MALALMALLGACSSDAPVGPPPPPVSPNGEPLVSGGAGVSCEAALGSWFDAADLNHDGGLDMAEFAADGARWFAVMDANHDGAVTPGRADGAASQADAAGGTAGARLGRGSREP
ncbi:MAG: hypothetical protein WDO24_30270 [Pseudomonadota bacterium]